MQTPTRGFTLIELLVVVTIIVALLALLMPAMSAAIDRAETTACQANQRQLAIAYAAYAIDNTGAIMQGVPVDQPDAFVYTGAGYDPIKKGALYRYLNTVKIYQCPADPNGNERSYVIPGTLRGEGWTGGGQMGVERITAVINHSKQLAFMEESDSRGWNIGSWLMAADDANQWRWVDYVGLFHDGQTADDMTFLDGHVERRKWQDATTINAGRSNQFHLYDPNNPDWTWLRPYYRHIATSGTCRFIPD